MPELSLPDPPLVAGSVVLRPWERRDVPGIVAACQDPEIGRWSPLIPSPYREADAVEWLGSQDEARLAGRALELAVSTDSGLVLGSIALSNVDLRQLRSSVGYWLSPEARGQGLASAAVRAIARWAFDQLGFGRLELFTHPENVASQRVAERCGFVPEGLMRSHVLVRRTGQRADSLVYGLLPGELR